MVNLLAGILPGGDGVSLRTTWSKELKSRVVKQEPPSGSSNVAADLEPVTMEYPDPMDMFRNISPSGKNWSFLLKKTKLALRWQEAQPPLLRGLHQQKFSYEVRKPKSVVH